MYLITNKIINLFYDTVYIITDITYVYGRCPLINNKTLYLIIP
jgi:hypothetical protein